MAAKKLSRNAPCPCGSGKKYKHCCYGKDFDWLKDEDGSIVRSVPMAEELKQELDEYRETLRDDGQEPDPDDLFFPDVLFEHAEHVMVENMKEAGVHPALIYAYEKTGLIVSEDNQDLIPENDLAKWRAAVEEYEEKHTGSEEPIEYPLGTIALYGPDDKTTTKIAAGVMVEEDAKPIIERWVGTDVQENPKVQREIQAFFKRHGVKSVAASDGNMGCPHEEGEDFPVGEDCPFCSFWKGKQGSNRKD